MEGKLSGVEMAEYARLRESVAQIEAALRVPGAMDAFTTGVMLRFLENAKGRIAGLEFEDSRKAEEERSKDAQEQRLAVMVERERALNTAEKQEYAALLHEEHFTRADFGRLEHFYAHSWDKLTDEGKGQLSYRVWEGVRQHQYKFTELPDTVKEKQAQQVEIGFGRPKGRSDDFSAIPENDREDFLRARKSGEREQSYQILDRPSFAPHVAVSPVSKVPPVEPARVAKMEGKSSSEEAQPLTSPEGSGSKNLVLQDYTGLDGAQAKLKPPLSELAGTMGGKVRTP